MASESLSGKFRHWRLPKAASGAQSNALVSRRCGEAEEIGGLEAMVSEVCLKLHVLRVQSCDVGALPGELSLLLRHGKNIRRYPRANGTSKCAAKCVSTFLHQVVLVATSLLTHSKCCCKIGAWRSLASTSSAVQECRRPNRTAESAAPMPD